jgi:hypothetical protein
VTRGLRSTLAFLAFVIIAFQIVLASPGLAAEDPTPNLDEFGYAPLALKEWAPTPTASPTSPANVLITNIYYLSDDGFHEEHVSFVSHGDESALVTDWRLQGPGDNVFVFPTFTLGSHRAAAVWT